MKRFLSLFLIVAILLSMSVMAINFSDEDEINYTDAVTVMTGLGIIQGDDNNNDGIMEFRPKDKVTRAEATKMIAYLLLGEDAEKLPVSESVFTDVDNSSWYAKYINYCAARNIVKGRGNGIFDPKGEITGSELAAILLRAIGYGVKGEYEGPSWDLNAVSDGLTLGLFDDSKAVSYSDAATREETALYIYNVMVDIYQVYEDVDLNTYVSLRKTLAESVWGLKWVETEVYSNQATGNEYTMTSDGKFDIETSLEVVGHQVKIWYKDNPYNRNVPKGYICKDISSVSAPGETYDDLYRVFVAKNRKNADLNLADISCLNNYNEVKNNLPDLEIIELKRDEHEHKLTGVFVFDKNGMVMNYMTTSYTIDLVRRVDDEFIYLRNYDEEIENTYKFEKGDYVTFYTVGDLVYLKPTTTKVVKISERSLKYPGYFNNMTIEPGVYDSNIPFYNGIDQEDIEVGDTIRFYLDCEGKYFGAELVEPNDLSGIVFVVKSWTREVVDDWGELTERSYVQCIDENGEDTVYRLSEEVEAPGVYKVYSRHDKIYLAAVENCTLSKKENKTSYLEKDGDIYYITDDTSIYYISGEGSNLTVTRASKLSSEDKGTYYANYHGDYVKTVWIIGDAPVVYENDYIFIYNETPAGSILYNGNPYDYYHAYVDGVYKEKAMIVADVELEPGFYRYSLKDGVYYIDKGPVDNVIEARFRQDYIYKDYLYYDADGISLKDIQIVNVVDNKVISVNEFEDMLRDEDFRVIVTYTYKISNSNKIPVAAIYIIKY